MMTPFNSQRQNIPPSQPSEAEGWELDTGNGLPQVEATCGIWVPDCGLLMFTYFIELSSSNSRKKILTVFK